MSTRTTLHFDLSHLEPGTEYVLSAFGRRHSLKRHSPETRKASGNRLLELLEGGFTHFLESVEPPADKIQILKLYGPADAHGIPSLAALYLYVPAETAAAAWADRPKVLPEKIRRRGIQAPSGDERQRLLADSTRAFDATDTAVALTFSHPELMVLTPQATAAVSSQLQQTQGLGSLASRIEGLKGAWVKTTVLDAAARPAIYQYDLHDTVLNLAAGPIQEGLKAVADDERLRGIRWHPPEGLATIPMKGAGGGSLETLTGTANSYQYVLRNATPKGGLKVEVEEVDGKSLRIAIGNSYVRHASIYARFFDAEDNAVSLFKFGDFDESVQKLLERLRQKGPPSWADIKDLVEAIAKATGLDYTWLLGNQTTRFIDSVSPVGLLLGIPVDSRPARFTIPFPKDTEVSQIRIFLGSLGQMSYVHRDNLISIWYGASETLVVDLLLPFLSICAGVGESGNVGEKAEKLFKDIFSDPKFILPILYDIGIVVWDWWKTTGSLSKDLGGLFLDLANKIVQKVLVNKEVQEILGEYLIEKELEESIPLVGTAMRVAALAATTAGLLQSVSEIIASPAVVEYDITLSLTAKITLRHDMVVGDAGFPATSKELHLVAEYSEGTSRTHRQALANPNVSEIVIVWEGIPIGGHVTFSVAFFSKEGWLVGKGSVGPLANVVPKSSTSLDVTIQIEELEYPLAASTTYDHMRLLTAAAGSFAWQITDTPPVETVSACNNANGGHNLAQLGSLALNTDAAVLGYAWRASGQNIPILGPDKTPTQDQVWAFQNVSLVDSPGRGLSTTARGLNARPQLAYLRSTRSTDGTVIADRAGTWSFFVDPRKTPQGFHLRAITPVNDPAVPPSDSRRVLGFEGPSWGAFPVVPDDLAVHPSGVVVALATETAKLMVLELPVTPGPDREALPAVLLSGPGRREGLLRSPVRLAVAPDGTLLVLEAAGRRFQAFDVQGNPVPYFQSASFFAPLHAEAGEDPKITYTGLALEVEGHLYVTSYEGSGYEAEQFRLDVYSPGGGHLFRQRGVNVAAMTVDMWRNLFTLNFQKLLGPGERTQPSVSEYIPSTPL